MNVHWEPVPWLPVWASGLFNSFWTRMHWVHLALSQRGLARYMAVIQLFYVGPPWFGSGVHLIWNRIQIEFLWIRESWCKIIQNIPLVLTTIFVTFSASFTCLRPCISDSQLVGGFLWKAVRDIPSAVGLVVSPSKLFVDLLLFSLVSISIPFLHVFLSHNTNYLCLCHTLLWLRSWPFPHDWPNIQQRCLVL